MSFELKSKRKRKVSRSKKTKTEKTQESQKVILDLFHISDKLPPESEQQILTWEDDWGWSIQVAALTLQHIHEDIRMFKKSRVTYWALLD